MQALQFFSMAHMLADSSTPVDIPLVFYNRQVTQRSPKQKTPLVYTVIE